MSSRRKASLTANFIESISRDIRYGVRALLATPAFTAIAVIVLALGIGANSAIFTVVNSVLLRPLPYPDSDRLMMLWETNPRFQIGIDTLPVAPGNFVDWQEQNKVFDLVSAFGVSRLNLTGEGQPERVEVASVSANFFELMRTHPVHGRAFRSEEEQPGADKVAVISHAFWNRRFAADPDSIGKVLTLDGESYTVIGIAPEGFKFPGGNELPHFARASSPTDVWRPMTLSDEFANRSRANHQLCVIGRLKSGVSVRQAQAEMTHLAERLEQSFPETNQGIGVRVVPLAQQVTGNSKLVLLVVMGAAALVLLIACANVANLMLARSAARQKEIAIRTALGASRLRVVGQLLTEALLLSVASSAAGMLLGGWGTKALVALAGSNLPRAYEVGLDLRVLAFAAGLALITTALFGLAPALQASKINLSDSLKEGARGISAGNHARRFRSLLVISEVALSLVLLIAAGLMIKSLARLFAVDPGFKPANALTMQIPLPGSKYPDASRQIAFFRELTRQVEPLPGVQSVGLVSAAPLTGGAYAGGFSIDGRESADNADSLTSDRRMISPGYFEAIGIPLIKGRSFTSGDDENAPRVAIVSESFARRFVADGEPLERRIKLGGRDSTRQWLSIVGIAGDVREAALDSDVRPCVYVPYPQFPASAMTLIVRAASDAKGLAASIRDGVWSIDRDQPVTDVKTMEEYVADSVSRRRSSTLLLMIFAAVALVLASVGVYGVIAYSVTQRVHEIGIRMALGARTSDVLKLVVGSGMMLVCIGVLAGLAAALVLTRVMSGLLYGVGATDPLTFAVVSVVLLLVALAATYIPARKATKVDPMQALRCE